MQRDTSGAPPRRKVVIDGSPAGSGCESNATEEPPITSDKMYLRAFVEKTPTRYFSRHNGFAAEPLMEPEVRGQDRRGPVIELIALRLCHSIPFWG
jgi:hypothetical protein